MSSQKKVLSKIQEREFLRSQAVDGVMAQNEKITAGYPAFSDEVKIFRANHATLVSLVPQKDINGTGVTIEKAELKQMTASLAFVISERTTAYAIKKGDSILLKAVYASSSTIARLKDGDLYSFANQLVTTITPLLTNTDFEKYNVTAEMLTSLTGLATQFKDTFGLATQADGSRSFASRSINTVLKAIRGNIAQLNFLIGYFQESNPKFVNDYRVAAAIDKSNIRHSGIEGIVNNAATGSAIEGATITAPGNGKLTHSNNDGTFRLIKLVSRLMPITITAPGFEPQTINIKIERGTVQQLNISLQTKVLQMPAEQTA